MTDLSVTVVAASLSRHLPLYRRRKPVYQTVLLNSLLEVLESTDRALLDIGGGTGVLAQAIRDLFPIDRIASVDVVDRFAPTLSIETRTFDGRNLPFQDGTYDAGLLVNVLHHVPLEERIHLLREISRVTGSGRIYIKDHLSTGRFDDVRLAVLDFLGNMPFHGMVRAWYLRQADWDQLAHETGYAIEMVPSRCYRAGLMGWLFPNRLEITMRWRASR